MHSKHTPFYSLDEFISSDQSPFCPKIFDARSGDIPPEGFNAVLLCIDGTEHSNLDWKDAISLARNYVQQGLRLFWQIDLGLFSRLRAPLSDRTQYLALGLALRHFGDHIWKEFQTHTLGLSLYRGPLDFSKSLTWNSENETNFQEWLKTGQGVNREEERHLLTLYSRDAALDYLELLMQHLPSDLTVCVITDSADIQDPLLLAQLLTKERFDKFHRFINASSDIGFGFLGEELHSSMRIEEVNLGICLPTIAQCDRFNMQRLRKAMQQIMDYGLPFRIVPEMTLTNEWNGLEQLVVLTDSVSVQGLRKLRGFCAAGGTVVTLGEPIGLPQEIPFSELTGSAAG